LSHTPSPSTHTHFALLHTHAHPVSQQVPPRGADKGSQEGEGSWGRRGGVESTPRDTLEEPFLTPVFDAFPCFVHTCRLLPTQNVAQQCRATVKAHLLRSGKQLAAEYASCSHSQGLRKGGDAAPCSRHSQAWGGVASSSPYLHATRPSGRISCGSSVKRIDGWREHRCSKEGKPVGGRATTITALTER
jgi:hypothetical protein